MKKRRVGRPKGFKPLDGRRVVAVPTKPDPRAEAEEREALEKLADPKFFVETFLFLVNKDRQRVPFLLNPPQDRYYRQRTPYDLILKSRKEGFSSWVEAEWLHACIYGENENCVTMAHTWEDTQIHLDRVKYYIENMEGADRIKVEVPLDTNNQRELYFPHSNSRYWIGTAGSKAFGRGRDITKLHLSEVAHYADQTVLTGIIESCVLSDKTRRVLETTANGVGEAFHRMWKEAGDPASGSLWKQHFFPWFEDPKNALPLPTDTNVRFVDQERKMQAEFKLSNEQLWWYRNKRAGMADRNLMPQEYPSNDEEAFVSSGRHVFDLGEIGRQKKHIESRPPQYQGELNDSGEKIRVIEIDNGPLKIWQPPRIGGQYFIPADACEGVPNGDFAVAGVIDRSNWQMVATLRLRVEPGEWGRMLVTLGRYYNDAVLCPENNSIGAATLEAIAAEEYEHVLTTKDLWPENEAVKKGFPTNDKTRRLAISALQGAVNDGTYYIPDPVVLGEMETFVQNAKTGKMEAQQGCHDDCVMMAAIGIYCVRYLTVDETYGAHRKRKDVLAGLATQVVKPPTRRFPGRMLT